MRKFSYTTISLVLFLIGWICIGSFYSFEINKLTASNSEVVISELDCLYDLIPSSQGATGTSRKSLTERHLKLDEKDFEKLYFTEHSRFNVELKNYKNLHTIVSYIVISDNFFRQTCLTAYHILFCTWRI